MEQYVRVKFIIHSDFDNEETFLILLDIMKKIEGKVIDYEFDSKRFDEFNYYYPTNLLIKNSSGTKSKNYTLNLIIGTNIYHIYSWTSTPFLYELLFYNEKALKIIVKNEEIKEYDEFGKFKRVSLINAERNSIMINETKINPIDFLEYINGNSYQCSFYDIKNKYIATKKIESIKNETFETIYDKINLDLQLYDKDLEELKKSSDDFLQKFNDLLKDSRNCYITVESDINFFLNKRELLNTLNDLKYFEFFYLFAKIKIIHYFAKCNDKTKENFIKLFKFFNNAYIELQGNKDLEIFEKIQILLGYELIFCEYCDNLSFQSFFEANLYYLKLEKAEKNSVIDLSKNFLNYYINGLNEESPSYFNLVEINSGIGYYNLHPVFIYDIIPLSYLKKHLKETLPSVIIFYNEKNTNNIALLENIIGSICINEAKIFGEYKKIKLDVFYSDEKISKINDISMKLSKALMHECFGHTKIQIHSKFNSTPLKDTPIKCFVDKKYKTLGNVNKINEENVINILHGKEKKNDSGHYFELSFGKLKNTNYYTMTLLSLIKHCGKLINSPELFYNKDNLEKLQKYVYYKYIYEKNAESKNEEKQKERFVQKENKEKLEEKEDEIEGEKAADIIELKEEDDIITEKDAQQKKEKLGKKQKAEKEEANDESFDNLSINEELNRLIELFPDKYYNIDINFKNIVNKNKINFISSIDNEDKERKFISRKISRKKENQEVALGFNKNKNKKYKKLIKIKKKEIITKSYSRAELLEILSRNSISNEEWNYYFELYSKWLLRY